MSSTLPTFASLAINAVSLTTSSYGLYSCSSIVLPPSLRQAGHKQFLTNLSAAVTILTNLCNVVNFFVQRGNFKSKGICNFVSRHAALPLALVLESIVASIYWPLRLFAMQLILQDVPKEGVSPIPLRVDISIHLLPITFLLCDHYLSGTGQKFKISFKTAWIIITALGLGYKKYLSLLIDPDSIQAYPYPFLNVQEPKRTIIFIAVTTFSLLYYVLYQTYPPTPKARKVVKTQ